jgi:hypothetical protein
MADTADGAVSLSTIGAVSGLLAFAGLAYATVQAGGGFAVAGLVGGISGVGMAFLVPYLVRLDRFGRADPDSEGGRVNPGAVGAALGATGFVILAIFLIADDPLVAAGIGVPLAGLEFVIWSLALPQAADSPPEPDREPGPMGRTE